MNIIMKGGIFYEDNEDNEKNEYFSHSDFNN